MLEDSSHSWIFFAYTNSKEDYLFCLNDKVDENKICILIINDLRAHKARFINLVLILDENMYEWMHDLTEEKYNFLTDTTQ